MKIHGSANWLYCDNCRHLFWFHPDESSRIADQLVRGDDLLRVEALLPKRRELVKKAIQRLRQRTEIKCLCSEPLATRIATFSCRKALDFPMFQKSWLAAEELLRYADKWVFIGYSLPAADYEFKYLLKRTQLSRPMPPELIVIAGGKKDDMSRTRDNYRKFFGRDVRSTNFFGAGLTEDAVSATCQ